MKILYFFLALGLICCKQVEQGKAVNQTDSAIDETDSVADVKQVIKEEAPMPPKVYYNRRFKDVTVEKTGKNTYLIQGKGQIFEASFSWVIEDGHNELKKGFEMTDAGAPEWGNFKFSVEVQKERENTVLHLILFEASAKDGSRLYELPILLK